MKPVDVREIWAMLPIPPRESGSPVEKPVVLKSVFVGPLRSGKAGRIAE
jgi:hypothetical protein